MTEPERFCKMLDRAGVVYTLEGDESCLIVKISAETPSDTNRGYTGFFTQFLFTGKSRKLLRVEIYE